MKPDVHLNLAVRGLPPSATVAINERCNELIAQGHDICKLGLGQSPFPVPRAVVETLIDHAHEKDYLAVRGLPALREAVAAYHNGRENLKRSAEDVLVGPGSKELMFLLQMAYYGDLVIPTPSWVSYAPQAKILGRQVRLVETERDDGYRLSPERLDALCNEDPNRPRILILNYPSNPTGETYTIGGLKRLAEVARRHRVVLLSDEIYGELHHRGQHVSVARYYPQGTIISSGLSKWCGAGGWRLGTFSFPPEMRWLLDGMASVASETFTSTSAPIQYAAVRAFQFGPSIEQYLRNSRRILGGLGRWVASRLQSAGLWTTKPQGGFYLMVDFASLAQPLAARGITSSPALTAALLEEADVAVLPGVDFGRPQNELSTRLAYVAFDGGTALDAVDRLDEKKSVDERFIKQHCQPLADGIQRICDWAQGLR